MPNSAIHNSQSSPFIIYNASAGSGKTFTIAKEFLAIILKSEDPFKFQQILAITFTNKAALEMRVRIIDYLESFINKDSEGKVMLDLLAKQINLSKEQIIEKSKKVLDNIILNYDAFQVTTLDSFISQIINSFTYELNVSSIYQIEFDVKKYLDKATERIFEQIGEDEELTKFLNFIVKSKVKSDEYEKGLEHQLKSFAYLLEKEGFRENVDKVKEIETKKFSKVYENFVRECSELKNRIKEIAKDIRESYQKQGIVDNDFSRGSLPKVLVKLEKGDIFNTFSDTVIKSLDGNLYPKTKSEEIKAILDRLKPEIREQVYKIIDLQKEFANKNIIKNGIPNISVITRIMTEFEKIKKEENIEILSDFKYLINSQIIDEPNPILFERLGNKITHYFIDEMQDTSKVVWNIYQKLISNALSQTGGGLYLVGDLKQSIYYFKGDAGDTFYDLSIDKLVPFDSVKKQIKTLQFNYRSDGRIVEFNNAFFNYLSEKNDNEKVKKVFGELNQQIPKQRNKNKKGYIEINYLEENKEEKVEFGKVLTIIKQQKKNGRALNDICVLLNSNDNVIEISSLLIKNGISVADDNSSLLNNNPEVSFLIDLLKYYQSPNEETRFNILYFLHHKEEIKEELHSFLEKNLNADNSNYGKIESSIFENNSLFDLFHILIRQFKLVGHSNNYLNSFLEIVLNYQSQKNNSILKFLSFWDDKKSNFRISRSETVDGVNVMTIHKAKGLEFPVVIFVGNIRTSISGNDITYDWIDTQNEKHPILKEINSVPIRVNSKLENTDFSNLYTHHKAQFYFDKINLMYVMMTRPKNELYLVFTEPKKKYSDLNNFIKSFLEDNKKFITTDNKKWIFGEKEKIVSENRNEIENKNEEVNFVSTAWEIAKPKKMIHIEFTESIQKGKIYHKILEFTETKEDLKKAILKVKYNHPKQNKVFDKVEVILNELLEKPLIAPLFLGKDKVLCEREMINEKNEIRIADRLNIDSEKNVTIIDYKTGEKSEIHFEQINEYANILLEMGYQIKKKLIIYLSEEIQIIEVE